MKTTVIISGLFIVFLVAIYLLGPTMPVSSLTAELPKIEISEQGFNAYLKQKEDITRIKPDNESRVFWANDSLKTKTPYCLLYLHGFSASWFEGNPVHVDFAKRYGMNLYVPLLAAHGNPSDDALLDMSPVRLYDSAKEALVAVRTLGQKIILMGTSTGGTLALKLAADFPDLVEGLILLSPNIAINNPAAFLLDRPWGLQLLHLVYKGNYRITNTDKSSVDYCYWNGKYRVEAMVYLQQLVRATMNKETFEKVTHPVFLGYYYKDEENQDQVVKVSAMLEMFGQLATPENKKLKTAFPEAGAHVIGCQEFSKSWLEVEQATFNFAETVLGLSPIR